MTLGPTGAAAVLFLGAAFAVAQDGTSAGPESTAETDKAVPGSDWGHAIIEPPRVKTDRTRPDRRRRAGRVESPVSVDPSCRTLYGQIKTTSGEDLVTALRSGSRFCISRLEWLGSEPELQIAASSESHLIDVAGAIPVLMTEYGQSEVRREVANLFLYLRMVFDIHYWCRTHQTCGPPEWVDEGPYSLDIDSPAGSAVKAALDSFVAHPLFVSAEDGHALALGDAMIAVSEFEMGEHYLDSLTAWLTAWDDQVHGLSRDLIWSVGRVIDIAFWCHFRESECGPAFGADTDLGEAFLNFVLEEQRIGSSSQRLIEFASLELGRFSRYHGTANYVRLPVFLGTLREKYETGPHRKTIWLRTISEIDFGDPSNCARYGLCDWYADDAFQSNLKKALFSERRTCSMSRCTDETITVHSQALTEDELETACERLDAHNASFQSLFNTQCKPIAGDRNVHLDMFVYADGSMCEDLDWKLFGGDSCSGIYFEGDPADPSSVATTIVTEKEPGDPRIDPELAIWNFEHEYAHYLDGRYNFRGGYQPESRIQGWSEGFAEFFATSVTDYHRDLYCVSPHSLAQTMLDSGSLGTSYNQRHLAVTLLMTMRSAVVHEFVALTRTGDFDAAFAYLARESSNLETAWEAWLAYQCARLECVPDEETLCPQVTASFGAARYQVSEGGSAVVRVLLSADPEQQLTIQLNAIHQGGATISDYSGVPENVTFNGGTTAREFTLTATVDGDDEDGESVVLSFVSLPPRVTGSGETTIAISENEGGGNVGGGDPGGGDGGGPPPEEDDGDDGDDGRPPPDDDDDPPPPPSRPRPTVSVSAASASESAGAVVFDVRLSRTSSSAVTVDYATTDGARAAGAKAGSDYTGTNGTLRIPAGSMSGQIRVPVTDDGEDEAEVETFTLTLRSPVNATLAGGVSALQVTGSIEDDDDPAVEVSFGSSSYVAPEGGSVEVTVMLSGDPERELAIPLVVRHLDGASESDYSGVPELLTFSSGATARTFEFVAVDDSEEDFGESVVLDFGDLPAGVRGIGSSTVSIDDDDTPPMAAIEVGGAACDRELCRALTGESVQFSDGSTGPALSRRWEFGEGTESSLRRLSHRWSKPGFYEVTLWVSDGARESRSARVFLVESSDPAGSCVSNSGTRCLQDSRYAVTVEWRKADGESGAGRVVYAGTNDSGLFTFFSRTNWEILVKVLDGCAVNGHVWVYGASTTDLGYTIRVTDTVTGTMKEYRNSPGVAAPAITDVAAFAENCSP